MGEKTVTLSAYVAEQLEKYREINDRYEKIVKETYGFEMAHLEDDNSLIHRAICTAINEYSNNIKNMEDRKAEVHHDT